MRHKRTFIVLLIAATVCSALPTTLRADTPVWEEADRTFKAAYSQFTSQRWAQAQGLLEDFVRRFGTHERVPIAYLYLAVCHLNQGNEEEYEAATEQVMRRFFGSPTWFLAYGSRMTRARQRRDGVRAEARKAAEEAAKAAAKAKKEGKEPPPAATAPTTQPKEIGAEFSDAYFLLLEQFARRVRRVPMELQDSLASQRPEWNWYQIWERRHLPRYDQYMVRVYPEWSWTMQILAMADTPERAERALRALAYTFRTVPRLPTDWQFAHVQMLRIAGQDEQADTAWDEYLAQWEDDPRGMGLWLTAGEWAQQHGDDETADVAWDQVVERYGGYYSVGEFLGERLRYLREHARREEFFKLARHYMKTYPHSRWNGSIVSWWTDLARGRLIEGDEELLAETTRLVEAEWGAESERTLRWKIELALARGQATEALDLMDGLLDERHWDASTFSRIENYARQVAGIARSKEDAELEKKADAPVAAARDKYGIPVEDPESPAAAMYKDLKARIKDSQLRHMEEIADGMFREHRKDYYTIEAFSDLHEFYFRNVMPDQRDRTYQRMVSAWPQHPRTQQVMQRQVQAEQAANRYQELGKVIDLLTTRFPGGPTYYGQRRQAFSGTNDEAGLLEYVRERYGPAAENGSVHALEELSRYEVKTVEETATALGGYWMDWANKLKGTRAELYALRQALDYYYWRPYHYHHLEQEPQWDKATAVVRRLASQDTDPEIAWNAEFLDVRLLADKDDARGAYNAMTKKLDGVTRFREITGRASLSTLGRAMGEKKMIDEAKSLADRLNKLSGPRDEPTAVEHMLGTAYQYAGAPIPAAKHFLNVVDATPFPAKQYNTFMHALRMLHGQPQTTVSTANQFINKVPTAQDIVPDVLFELGKFYVQRRDRGVNSIRSRLAQRYPASHARGELERMIEEAEKRYREQQNR